MPCRASMRTRPRHCRLASILIACNLGCDLRRENKVLVSILFLIGGFHFDHLYKGHVTEM
jgi:hypothetical protein